MKQANLAVRSDAIRDAEATRRNNLRQLLLRASRTVNSHVVERLRAKGYTRLRSTHTTLLSNLPLAGASVTEVAQRAGITKQAMGRLASELEKTGYLKQDERDNDGRVRKLMLTTTGVKLMFDSFEVMASLQKSYAEAIGSDQVDTMMRGLAAIIELGKVMEKA